MIEDRIERLNIIKNLFFRYYDRIAKERVEAITNDTSFIPLVQLTDVCEWIKTNLDELPRNVAKAIISRFYASRPKTEAAMPFCPACHNTGREFVELIDPPFFFVMPCSCPRGEKFKWMNNAKDTAVMRYLEKRGFEINGAKKEDYAGF